MTPEVRIRRRPCCGRRLRRGTLSQEFSGPVKIFLSSGLTLKDLETRRDLRHARLGDRRGKASPTSVRSAASHAHIGCGRRLWSSPGLRSGDGRARGARLRSA